jgi:hypothetical protein
MPDVDWSILAVIGAVLVLIGVAYVVVDRRERAVESKRTPVVDRSLEELDAREVSDGDDVPEKWG